MVVAEKRFADPMPVAYGTIAFLAIGALLDIARLASALSVSRSDPRTFVPHAEAHMLVRALTMIAFAVWIERVWRNLSLFGEPPDTSRTWAVLSFFVPPFCFYRPVLVVSEAWNDSGGQTSPPWFAQLATAWWVALMTPIAVILTFRGRLIGVRGTMIVAELFNIIAAGLAISVVCLLSMQQRLAAAARAVPPPVPEPPAAIGAGSANIAPSVAAPSALPPAVPVAVAAATRQVKTAAAMLERVVNAPRKPQNPLHLLDRIPPRLFQAALMFVSLIVAAAMLLAAAALYFERRDLPAALIHGGLAAVLAAATLALRADRAALADRRRLAGFAAAGAAIAVVAFLAILEGLLR